MAVLAGPMGDQRAECVHAQSDCMMRALILRVQTTFIISEDGDRIIEDRDFSDGDIAGICLGHGKNQGGMKS